MADPLDFADKPTVLIVDDVPENLQILNAVLQERYKVRVANRGELALKLAATWPLPELILLDIEMPGTDGYEVCQRLKGNPLTADIPVIFVTAKSEVADEQKGFDLGCVDYVTKPVSPPRLLARVRTHIRLRRAQEYLRDQKRSLEFQAYRRASDPTRSG
jgi:putative two-component system response regulator